jgi:hypothetical protein
VRGRNSDNRLIREKLKNARREPARGPMILFVALVGVNVVGVNRYRIEMSALRPFIPPISDIILRRRERPTGHQPTF